MGNSASGFRDAPQGYLREIRRETNLRLRDIVRSRSSLERVQKSGEGLDKSQKRGLSQKDVEEFILANPEFLDNCVKTHISQNRIKSWLKLSISSISEPGQESEPVNKLKSEEFAAEIVERNFRQRRILIITRNHLSYPFRFRLEELQDLITNPVTKAEFPELDSHLFPYTEIYIHDINRVFISMAIQLFGPYGFPFTELCYFLSTLRVNYFDIEYHNFNHALSHAQSMFWILNRNPGIFTENEMKGLMIASIAHDAGHFGVNEKYLRAVENGLERMYHSPILEHHHTEVCFLILADINCNVFCDLKSEDYKLTLRCIRHAIRSTEMSRYRMQIDTMRQLLSSKLDFENVEVKYAVISLMMMACDLCAAWKRWPEHKEAVWSLYKEFFNQGDKEMRLRIEPLPQMTRMNSEKIPEFQIAFTENLALPIFELIVEIFPNCKPILAETKKNCDLWKTYVTS